MTLTKGIIIICFLLFTFYYLTPNDSGFVNAGEEIEEIEQNNETIEDIKFTAGVETILETEDKIENDIKITNKEEISYDLVGYTTANVNVRDDASIFSNVIEIMPFNTKIQYRKYNKDWVVINHNNTNCYISNKYISDKPVNYTSYNVPDNSGFKSYMSYKTITNKTSKQYNLQQKAHTGDYGIRMVSDRYCVVLGTYFKKEMEIYFLEP